MSLPVGFPPRKSPGRRTFRFFQTGTLTANFADAAHFFTEGSGNGDGSVFAEPPVVKAGDTSQTTSPVEPTSRYQHVHVSDPQVFWSSYIRVFNDGIAAIEVSFDGANVHGKVKAGEVVEWRHRIEGGIALRSVDGTAVPYRAEAW